MLPIIITLQLSMYLIVIVFYDYLKTIIAHAYTTLKNVHNIWRISKRNNCLVKSDSSVDGFASYYCECSMSYIDCVPEDRLVLVLYCDASSAQVLTLFLTAGVVKKPYSQNHLTQTYLRFLNFWFLISK